MKNVFQNIFVHFSFFIPFFLFSSICFADKAEDLQKLKDLYEQDILTKEQYNAGVDIVLKNIEIILKDSEEMKKLNDLFEDEIITEDQFKEGKQKILNKIGINLLEDTSTSSQQVEKDSFDEDYEVEIVWSFVNNRVPPEAKFKVGSKDKLVFEIKDNQVISIKGQDNDVASINSNNSKMSRINFNLKETGELRGSHKFKLDIPIAASANLYFYWNCQIIDKKIIGKVEVMIRKTSGSQLMLKGDVL